MKKFILFILSLGMIVSGCGRKEDLQPSIKLNEAMKQYRNMTYGDFNKTYEQRAEFFHADRFIALIPDTELAAEFTAAECGEDFVYFLKDSDKCTHIEGKLGNMVDGLLGETELEDFAAGLVWRNTEKEGLMPIYSIVQGESTAYYVSDIYAEVEFDSDGDNTYDTRLQISLLPSGKIGEDSVTWLYLND